MNNFTVTTEVFSGPIDALLQMIEKRKMPINDISLANITDDYIRFVQNIDDDSLSSKTHFIFVASTLILIKSKSLLPTLDLTTEEEGDINELKRRIALLKEYQNASQYIKLEFTSRVKFNYPRTRKREISFKPHKNITQEILLESLSSVLHEVPEKKQTQKEAYVRIAVHIEEMMQSLEKRITQTIKSFDFNSFIANESKEVTEERDIKVYKVVGFLAMLELVKNGALTVLQNGNFSNIDIEKV